MGNVNTDKLKQLLYAMIETLDEDNSSESTIEDKQNTTEDQSMPSVKPKRAYASGENLFLSMPEKDMHKADVELDKKLAPKQLTARNRKATEIEARCRVCGKEKRVSRSLVDGSGRYKCNDCSRSAG